jgi:hypothetical protein
LYLDDDPIFRECGNWTIDRHWYIRPVYEDCIDGVPLDETRLVTERVQVITILDIYAPEFIVKPNQTIRVPFLQDYGPNATGYPQIEDMAYHETLTPFNLFFSYPINLTFADENSFAKTPTEVCGQDAIASVIRTWTTVDNCGHTRNWIQNIDIGQPTSPLFGNVTGFQMAAIEGEMTVHSSTIHQDVSSSGEDFHFHGSFILGSQALIADGNCRMENQVYSEYSLVLDHCPKNLQDSALRSGNALYGQDDEINCKTFEKLFPYNLEEEEKPPLQLKPVTGTKDEFVQKFELSRSALGKTSHMIAEGPNELFTGPLIIWCTEVDQASCSTTEETVVRETEATVDNDGNLLLESSYGIYNVFRVAVQDWFYHSEWSEPRNVTVDAPGFVFVTVFDYVEISDRDSKYVDVKRSWFEDGDFKCDMKWLNKEKIKIDKCLERKDEAMKRCSDEATENKDDCFRESIDEEKHKCSAKEKDDMEKCSDKKMVGKMAKKSPDLSRAEFAIREIHHTERAERPASHLVVNLVTEIDHKHSWDEELAEMCSGLRYEFTKHGNPDEPYDRRSSEGTYMMSNRVSSLNLQFYDWEGGQFVSQFSKLNLNWVEIGCGLYLPNTAHFCSTDTPKQEEILDLCTNHICQKHSDCECSNYCDLRRHKCKNNHLNR